MGHEIDWQERCKKLEEGFQEIKHQIENFWVAKGCAASDEKLEDFIQKAYDECTARASNDIERVDCFEKDESQAKSSEADKPFKLEDVEVDIQEENQEALETVESTESESDEDVENIED